MLDLELAADLDRSEPAHRDLFDLPDGVVYLDGNSLGAMPSHLPEVARLVVESQWGEGLIRSWNDADWVSMPERVGDRIGRIIGAPPGTTIACDSTSVNLYKVVNVAMDLSEGPPVIVTDASNFPSDRYVLDSIARRRGWRIVTAEPSALTEALEGGVGVASLTQVDYTTGRRLDLAETTAAIHDAGGLAVWDLAHSAGAFDVSIDAAGADFAVGCGYKYLNGGPGAPAFAFVAARHHSRVSNPIAGWFGHARPFDFSAAFEPAAGVDRMLVGTPHVVSLALLEAALDVFERVDRASVWDRGRRLVQHLFDGFRTLGLDVVTPPEPERRGSQVSFRHPQAYAIVQALIDRDVIGDFRTPDIARFGVAPLYVTHQDVARALAELRSVLDEDDLDRYGERRGEVV